MEKGKIGSIDILNRYFYINSVVSFLDSLVAYHRELDYERYNSFRYVVSELVRLRIQKAYPGSTGVIQISVYLTEAHLEVSIKDKGVPYWIDKSNDDSLAEMPIDYNKSKNKIYRYMTDGLGMENLGENGQRIFVRLNILHEIVFDEPEPYSDTVALDTNITIRPVLTKKDALEAIRCIYSEYGYSYSYQKFYYIDSFLKAIEKKEIMSFLAINDHGQTAGHFSLIFSKHFKNMPEISTVVTRKEFRGLGLFGKFMNHCMLLGMELNFKAFMGQPVAFHTMSQKVFNKAGFSSTAILFSYVHSEIESEYNIDKQRLDLFAAVKLLNNDSTSVIYPPDELQPFIEYTFNKIGIKYSIKKDFSPSAVSGVSMDANFLLKSTKIVVLEADNSFDEFLEDAIKDSIHQKFEMIEIFISLNTPSCNYAYNTAIDFGFNFTGLLPGSETADYIVMQMLIGSDLNYDKLVATADYEKLINDIKNINSERRCKHEHKNIYG